jgi:hypothetical protein
MLTTALFHPSYTISYIKLCSPLDAVDERRRELASLKETTRKWEEWKSGVNRRSLSVEVTVGAGCSSIWLTVTLAVV